MQLVDGYVDLPPGKLANVVTCLEMRERPAARDVPAVPYTIARIERAHVDWYRALFRRVGEAYLWGSRLALNDEQLRAILHDPAVHVYAVLDGEGAECGLLELDFRVKGECELTFFGLTAEHVGRGAGRVLMSRAIEAAWSAPIARFWVHTCTLDHPSAVDFYRRSGFVPFKRQIEIHDDPRAIGLLPETAAPNIPLL